MHGDSVGHVADVVDFSEWKAGRRATGIIYATILFALKTGLSLGGAVVVTVCLVSYPIGKRLNLQIQDELAERRKTFAKA
jgi:glycoside/pentoside/hexuronide:cation symporter, GPH family